MTAIAAAHRPLAPVRQDRSALDFHLCMRLVIVIPRSRPNRRYALSYVRSDRKVRGHNLLTSFCPAVRCLAVEVTQQFVGNKSRPLGITVLITPRPAGGMVISQRYTDGQRPPGARQRDIKQVQFLIELVLTSSGLVCRDIAVNSVNYKHRIPFQTFRGMDRAQNQIVLVELGIACKVLR